MKRTAALLGTFVLCAFACLAEKRERFEFIDLGTLPDGTWSSAVAINNRGQVAGTCQAGNTEHACFWFKGHIHDLGAPAPGEGSGATAINDLGQVVGVAISVQGADRAVMWAGGKVVELGTLGGDLSMATGINNRGQVIGASTDASGQLHAFLWQNGTMRPLDALGIATAINNRGTIGGELANSVTGVILRRGHITQLGSLGGKLTLPKSISERGDVVGWSAINDVIDPVLASVITHAFLYRHGRMTDIQTLPSAILSFANNINNSGEIVGSFLDAALLQHAVVWLHEEMFPLDAYVPPAFQAEADAVNDKGVIVGSGLGSVGRFPGHAFMLIPREHHEREH